jgi:hypothetical protein
MRGFIFTEFAEMVEERYGLDTLDDVIAHADSSCDGAYVAVDTYSHEEFVRLITCLSGAVDVELPILIRSFGELLFGRLAVTYSHLVEGMAGPLAVLERLDDHVHFEVQKLEPEAQLPSFHFERTGPRAATMTYESERALPDLAEGLLIGCFGHFGMKATIRREDRSNGAGSKVNFYIQQRVGDERT